MLKQCENVLQAVGETPLIRLNRVVGDRPATVFVKLEQLNPGGSIKDRIAVAMVDAAERDGLLRPGGTIVEATAGNTGVGLAMVAAVRGYRCIFVVPDQMSGEKIRLLKAYGAEVVMTDATASSNSSQGYIGVASRLAAEIPNAWQPNQFANLANPDYHYRVTGPEVWYQTEGTITAFVAGIGTGGTISGAGRYLKERNANIQVVGADPEGSILAGGAPGHWLVEGIGQDYVPHTFNSQIVDDWITVGDGDSFRMARQLATREGLLVGGAAGTAVTAALRYAERLGPKDVVVAICPDGGHNYLSQMYSDEWMIEHGFLESPAPRHSAGELLEAQGLATLISVAPDDTAEDAIQTLRKHEISQVPVLENGINVGCIRELTLARLLHAHMDPRRVPVREIMARPMPEVDASVDLDEVYRLLSAGNTGVVVLREGAVAGIVTRIDLVSYWDRLTDEPHPS